MAKVSIITASYNYENYIKETIESVIKQIFSDWEMIIVDDGSKDNSVNVIKEYCNKDSRIKLYQHENGANKGLAETIKLGLSKANADWIIFLESDDTITEDYISEKLSIIEKYKNVSLIFNDINMFGEIDAVKEYENYFEKQKKILAKYNYPTNLLKAFRSTHTNLIPTFSCVMVKKDCFNKLDFDSPIKKTLDLYLWWQIVKDNEIYYLEKKLTNWRMHKNSYISAEKTELKMDYYFKNKRIEFLYCDFVLLRKALLWLTYIRKQILQIHLNKKKKELVLFGKCIELKSEVGGSNAI